MNEDGTPFVPDDAHAAALRDRRARRAGPRRREDVLRTRFYVTCIDRADDFGRAHREFFGDHAPCLTMVEVARLSLVEIEADGDDALTVSRPGSGDDDHRAAPTPSTTSRTRISVSAASSASPCGAHVQAPEVSE